MKAHIEYDDLGEFEEILEDDADFRLPVREEGKSVLLAKKVLRKLALVTAAMTVLYGTSSYAAFFRIG